MEPTTYETTARVNVRAAPDGKVVDVLPTGAQVKIVNLTDEWAETSESEYIKINYVAPAGEPEIESEEGTDDET